MLLLILFVVLLPLYFVYALAQFRDPEEAAPAAVPRRSRLPAVAIVAAAAYGSVAYRVVAGQGLDQTAALFIGVPTVLAVAVILIASPRSALGVACKAMTVGLLLSLVFLWEGILCVVMAAPLFYAVALGIGAAVDKARRSHHSGRRTLSCLAILALVPMSFEGVTETTSLSREESVTVSRVVPAPADAVERALLAPPRFDRALPTYLRAGFPRPVAHRVERDEGGVRWVIRFRGGEMRIDGMEPRAGDLILDLVHAESRRLSWRAAADDSHMTHFLQWRHATVEWAPAGAGATRVTWTLSYRRGLDPAWYFGPWERYAVRLAAGYLIDAVATP
jgi:hypothetical protein